MLIKNVTRSQLYDALQVTSEQFDGNVTFNRMDFAGHTRREWLEKYNVTLKVRDSHKPGHRLSFDRTTRNGNTTQYTMVAACWHVHRTFFDTLAREAPGVEIVTSLGRTGHIDETTGKYKYDPPIVWHAGDMHSDPMVGSPMYPQYASELCECGT